MKYGKIFFVLLLMVFAFNIVGCSRFSAPSDEEVIKAINDTGLFSGGPEKFTLKSPIVILGKGDRGSDGSWPVTVKVTFTFKKPDGQESSPQEKTPLFRVIKQKDASGKTVWKAILN
jgi:hypothetical protein